MSTTETWVPVEPLADAEPISAAYWEPWQPKVGGRVRVRITRECPVVPKDGLPMAGEGIVLSILDVPEYPGHYYEVAGKGDPDAPGYQYFGGCAAVELERLDP